MVSKSRILKRWESRNIYLIYNTCDSISGVYRTSYKTSEKNISCTIEGGTVQVTLEDKFFTDQYLDKEPTYLIRFFENGTEVSTAELGSADIEEVEETSEGGFGGATTTIVRTAKTESVSSLFCCLNLTNQRNSIK